MYLHEDREMFRTIVEQVAEESGKNSIVIEKDYYVTMILRLLSEQLELCVFKGGTSLSEGVSCNQSFFGGYRYYL